MKGHWYFINMESNLIKENTDYYNDVLESTLDLERKIVGIKIHIYEEDFKNSSFREVKRKIAYCTLVRNATQGEAIKIAGSNFACFGSATSLGITESRETSKTGIRQFENSTYKNMPISRSYAKQHNHIGVKTYGVSIAPLKCFNEDPDVVIIVCNPYNAMRLIHGYNYSNSYYGGFDFIGLGAICREVTSLPYENNKINVSVMCPGTRMLCQWGKEEMAVGVPFDKFDSMVEGVVKTINPFERNASKKKIIRKITEKGIELDTKIELNKNYDDGAYVGLNLEELKKFKKSNQKI